MRAPGVRTFFSIVQRVSAKVRDGAAFPFLTLFPAAFAWARLQCFWRRQGARPEDSLVAVFACARVAAFCACGRLFAFFWARQGCFRAALALARRGDWRGCFGARRGCFGARRGARLGSFLQTHLLEVDFILPRHLRKLHRLRHRRCAWSFQGNFQEEKLLL